MLLYIHVPFCRAKCRYCAFFSRPLPTTGQGSLDAYLSTLEAEARLWGQRLGRPEVSSVFFGGGTPSLLPPTALERLVTVLGQSFQLPPGVEWTLEANPDSVTLEGLGAARELGINRLSLGVQSLRDADLRRLGRPHTADQALAAVAMARRAGLRNLGVDLIWGLPGQTTPAWLRQLGQVATILRPEHISAYSLTLEPGTPLAASVSAGQLRLPGEVALSRMFLQGRGLLTSHGYRHYEIANFARPGRACAHNLGYWQGRDYLGLGPSAVSTLGPVRRQNAPDLDQWAADVAAGRDSLPPEQLTPAIRAQELVLLRLRTAQGLELADYRHITGRPFLAGRKQLLDHLATQDLVSWTPRRLRLTPRGMLVSNAVLGQVLALEPEADQA